MSAIVLLGLFLQVGTASAASPSSCGSWSIVSSPDSGLYDELDGVAAISANDVWAVGFLTLPNPGGTQTLIQHWNGSKWSIVSSPNPGSEFNQLYGVAAISANDVWAVGYDYSGSGNGQALFEHWDGTQWSVVPGPNPGVDVELSGVVALSTNNVWAVGSLIEHWDGTQWSVVPSPSGDSLNGVAAISANDIWAVGRSFSGKYHTLTEHWNGTQWSVVSSANVGNGKSLFGGVAATSSNDVWAVGFRRNSKTLIEHWNGTQWKIVPSGKVAGGFNGIVAISTSNAWAVGFYVPSKRLFQTLIEHWDGSSWSVVSSPGAGSYSNLKAISVVPGTNNLWAVGLREKGNQGTLIEYYC
ncbi:MAG TPA: hypothetical protein VJ761_10970 [Ktedonobacteraceae bacterium]|nr:hypothetical protein [Ktedonobacteraceae bacterium]